jgi:hypothetical protein
VCIIPPSPPPRVDVYNIQADNTNTCTSGFTAITTPVDCQAAANAWGKTFQKLSLGNYPIGCSRWGSTLLFNSRTSGSARSCVSPVCTTTWYALQAWDTTTCPSGFTAITTFAECQTAATAMGKAFGATPQQTEIILPTSNRPEGCFKGYSMQYTNVFFNSHSRGSPNSYSSPICKRVPATQAKLIVSPRFDPTLHASAGAHASPNAKPDIDSVEGSHRDSFTGTEW